MKLVRRAAVGVVLALAAGAAGAQDLLVMRDGSRRAGALQSCVGERCYVGGEPVERAEIAWIGLAAAGGAPPAASQTDVDEIHLTDGSIVVAGVVGLSLGTVATESESHDRRDVTWIRFAGEDAPQPGQFGAPLPDLPSESAGPEGGDQDGGDPQAPAPPPAPPPGGYTPTGEPEIGPLWTGTAEASWVAVWDGAVGRLSSTVDPVRLREHRYPLLVPGPGGGLERVGTYLELRPEGTVFTTQSSLTVAGCSHSGSGDVTLLADEGGIAVFIKTVDVDTTPGVGWNVPLGPGRYFGSFGPRSTRVRFTTSGCGDSQEEGFWPLGLGKNIVENPVVPTDPQPRYLDGGGGRMSGSYTIPSADGTLTTSWNICREGVSCAGPPAPDEPPPPR